MYRFTAASPRRLTQREDAVSLLPGERAERLFPCVKVGDAAAVRTAGRFAKLVQPLR